MTPDGPDNLVAEGYDAVYAAWRSAPTLHDIWSVHALGATFPKGFEPISFVTLDELRRTDYAPVLEQVGLRLETYEETLGWRDRLHATYAALTEASGVLASEMGEPASGALLMEVAMTMEFDPYRRRILAVASKP